MDLKITPSGQTIVKPTALGPGANTDTKLLIYGLFQKGRVLAQDAIFFCADHSSLEPSGLGKKRPSLGGNPGHRESVISMTVIE